MSPPVDLSHLRAIDLTLVLYDPADPFGKLLAAASLVPIALLVSYATLLLFRRDIATGVMLLGQLLNEAFNMLLKNSIRERRPTAHLGEGYGMPSSHAQFIAYFSVYLILYTYRRLTFESSYWKNVIAAVLCAVMVAVSYSRIHLHYHSPEQAAVGVVIGTLFGMCWYFLSQHLILPLISYTQLLESGLFKFFLVRDTRGIPNLLKHEWTSTREELQRLADEKSKPRSARRLSSHNSKATAASKKD
ncbi:uncharacterized protein BJ171DRAFT_501941 [Polychytrium aggregatum]|uniref:uncharacterized protein n=1 Tax=Polychytrium aggregatum TaxID=110093 RepID=UPI0022FEDD4B|nr:uncharacterized protein BJ171DRAFT_501941 [Polychytrium aggregatum]KAI9205383.1 hypothetical protein BJ171DRAFT_501941 [Polychytrium aggregatum]